jgi:hypothetical protein
MNGAILDNRDSAALAFEAPGFDEAGAVPSGYGSIIGLDGRQQSAPDPGEARVKRR